MVPLSWSLDHCGPMPWTIQDTALMLQAIAGHDPKDPTSNNLPVPDYSAALREDVSGLTVGVPRHYFVEVNAGIFQEAVDDFENAISDLQELGAHVEEVNNSSLEYAQVANWVIMLSEAFAYHKKNLQTKPQNFGSIARHWIFLGGLVIVLIGIRDTRNRFHDGVGQGVRVLELLWVVVPDASTSP